jgi:hypothetical protein
MTDDKTQNRRREAAEAAAELRDAMREIVGAPGEDDEDIEASRHAAAALDALEHAETALRLWRDHEEEPIELLGEEPRDPDATDLDEVVVDRETARMVLARMHVVDAIPPCDAPRRSVGSIADDIDRDEEYVRDELERLAEWGVADLDEDGARLAHQRVVVEPLVSDDG